MAACSQSDNTGTACGDPQATYPSDPVGGENASIEVVRIDRDGACLSFNCLTAGGLPPYCTRPCTYPSKPAKAVACKSDGDCKPPLHCFDDVCQNDDCPDGFWCRPVQNVGPYQGKLFCTRRSGCGSDLDCEDIGTFACTELACYNGCPQPNTSCPYPRLNCKPTAQLDCSCNTNTATCPDANLVCNPNTPGQVWAAGNFERQKVCLPRHP